MNIKFDDWLVTQRDYSENGGKIFIQISRTIIINS